MRTGDSSGWDGVGCYIRTGGSSRCVGVGFYVRTGGNSSCVGVGYYVRTGGISSCVGVGCYVRIGGISSCVGVGCYVRTGSSSRCVGVVCNVRTGGTSESVGARLYRRTLSLYTILSWNYLDPSCITEYIGVSCSVKTFSFMLFCNGNSLYTRSQWCVLVPCIIGWHVALCYSVMELFLFPGGSSGCVGARYYRMSCSFTLFCNGNSFCSQVAAVDLLVPGVGELIGGSLREDDYSILADRLHELGMEKQLRWWDGTWFRLHWEDIDPTLVFDEQRNGLLLMILLTILTLRACSLRNSSMCSWWCYIPLGFWDCQRNWKRNLLSPAILFTIMAFEAYHWWTLECFFVNKSSLPLNN